MTPRRHGDSERRNCGWPNTLRWNRIDDGPGRRGELLNRHRDGVRNVVRAVLEARDQLCSAKRASGMQQAAAHNVECARRPGKGNGRARHGVAGHVEHLRVNWEVTTLTKCDTLREADDGGCDLNYLLSDTCTCQTTRDADG